MAVERGRGGAFHRARLALAFPRRFPVRGAKGNAVQFRGCARSCKRRVRGLSPLKRQCRFGKVAPRNDPRSQKTCRLGLLGAGRRRKEGGLGYEFIAALGPLPPHRKGRGSALKRLVTALFAFWFFLSPPTAAEPARIVSLDYCADQFVLALADLAQVAALSRGSRRDDSYFRARAAGIRQTRGTLEEVLALNPDLVVRNWGGPWDAEAVYARFGIAVLQVGDSANFSLARANVIQAARAFGHPERGAGNSARSRCPACAFARGGADGPCAGHVPFRRRRGCGTRRADRRGDRGWRAAPMCARKPVGRCCRWSA